MNWTLFVVCYSLAICFFIALFWPWDENKKKPTESVKIQKLQAIIDQLRIENEELQELIPTAMKLKGN